MPTTGTPTSIPSRSGNRGNVIGTRPTTPFVGRPLTLHKENTSSPAILRSLGCLPSSQQAGFDPHLARKQVAGLADADTPTSPLVQPAPSASTAASSGNANHSRPAIGAKCPRVSRNGHRRVSSNASHPANGACPGGSANGFTLDTARGRVIRLQLGDALSVRTP